MKKEAASRKYKHHFLLIKKTLFATYLLLSFSIQSQSQNRVASISMPQNKINNIKVLEPGDYLPMANIMSSNISNYPDSQLLFNDFKDRKLILLDFWSKYCSSCIAAMPKMQELQDYFGYKLQIILVTNNSKDELKELFKRSKILSTVKLPMIYSDTLLNKYFAHYAEPYYAWISGDGRVITKTKRTEVTDSNIYNILYSNKNTAIYSPQEENMPVPKDFGSAHISYLDFESGKLKNKVIYSNNISTGSRFRKQENVTLQTIIDNIGNSSKSYSIFLHGLPLYNRQGFELTRDSLTQKINGFKLIAYPILNLLNFAYPELYSTVNQNLQYKPVITYAAKDNIPTKYNIPNVTRYERESRFCYEIKIDQYSEEKALRILQSDIEYIFNIKLKVKPIKTKCLIIHTKDTSWKNKAVAKYKNEFNETISTALTREYSNTVFKKLITDLDQSFNEYAVFDETNIPSEFKISMQLRKSGLIINNNFPNDLKTDLEKYGITCRIEERLLNNVIIDTMYNTKNTNIHK